MNKNKIWLHSLGCRTNQSELESIASGLAERGFIPGDTPGDCCAAVINTCSVTATADKKSRQHIRMVRREMPPNALVIACGCWAQRLSKDEAKELGIDFVVPNRQKDCVVNLVTSSFPPSPFMERGRGVRLRSRAFIKIQEGCDHFCSYCIVPFLRGHPVSRPVADVVGEILSVSNSDCDEIVLTGTNLGRYEFGLNNIVDEISKMPAIKKFQFGSIEPFSIDEKLLRALARAKEKLSPPLHIPLQSGDDEILRLMKRGYTVHEYLEKIAQVREHLGDIALNTDLLVGFPGESEEAFQNSLDIIRKIGFAHVHIFPFSPRAGTAAAGFKNQVPRNIILERAKRAKNVNRD